MDDLEIIIQFGFAVDLTGPIAIKKIKYREVVYTNDVAVFAQYADTEDGLYHIIIMCEEKNMMFELTYDRVSTWQVLREDTLNDVKPLVSEITYKPYYGSP